MPWIRQLPSRLWAATIYTRPGDPKSRVTESFELKSRAQHWAAEQETAVRSGTWIDPRAGRMTVAECWEKWSGSRRLEKASRARDASHWRCHVQPRWGSTPIGSITQPDIQGWVVELEAAHADDCAEPKRCRGCRYGAATIEASVGVLRAALDLAVAAKRIGVNPCRDISISPRAAHVDRVLTPAEDGQLLGTLDRHHPNLPAARQLAELLLYCGLRWEEAAALDRDHVDLRGRLLHIGPVMERDGSIRPYPKSPAGVRTVPVDDDIWPTVRQRAMAVRRGALLFTAARGGSLLYSSWHRRVWLPAIRGATAPVGRGQWSPEDFGALIDEAMAERGIGSDAELARQAGISATIVSNWRGGRYQPRRSTLDKVNAALQLDRDRLCLAAGVLRVGLEGAGLEDPQPTPHDLRHTYGTRLAEQGVPPHEIMRLMGHEHLESTERYLHAGPGHFDRARNAVTKARAAGDVAGA